MISQTCFNIALKNIMTTLFKAFYHKIGLSVILNDSVNEILPVVHQTSIYLKLHEAISYVCIPGFFQNYSRQHVVNINELQGCSCNICVQDMVKILGISSRSNRNVWSNKETH